MDNNVKDRKLREWGIETMMDKFRGKSILSDFSEACLFCIAVGTFRFVHNLVVLLKVTFKVLLVLNNRFGHCFGRNGLNQTGEAIVTVTVTL